MNNTSPAINCAYDDLAVAADLKPNPDNPNRHDKAQLDLYAKILLHQGWRKAILVSNQPGFIVTGHGAWLTSKAQGWLTVPVDYQDFASKADEVAHMIADNKLAQMAEIDDIELAKLIKAELNADALDLSGIDIEGLREIGVVEPEPIIDVSPQIDRAAELQKKWGTQRGQLWACEHRLLCGSMEDSADVQRVLGGERFHMIFTDPPYGHNNQDGDLQSVIGEAIPSRKSTNAKAGNRPIANDGPEDTARVFSALCKLAGELLPGGCCCCCCCGGGGGPDPQFARWSLEMDRAVGFKHAVVWDKGGLGMGWHYRRCYEMVLVAEKPGSACHWFGGNDIPNVIRDIGKIIPNADQHPTEKPVELPCWFIRLHSQAGEIVFEPFAGSGSTLMACEQLGRRCRAIEIDPGYVAVALERWATATGKTPTLMPLSGPRARPYGPMPRPAPSPYPGQGIS